MAGLADCGQQCVCAGRFETISSLLVRKEEEKEQTRPKNKRAKAAPAAGTGTARRRAAARAFDAAIAPARRRARRRRSRTEKCTSKRCAFDALRGRLRRARPPPPSTPVTPAAAPFDEDLKSLIVDEPGKLFGQTRRRALSLPKGAPAPKMRAKPVEVEETRSGRCLEKLPDFGGVEKIGGERPADPTDSFDYGVGGTAGTLRRSRRSPSTARRGRAPPPVTFDAAIPERRAGRTRRAESRRAAIRGDKAARA